MIIKLNITMWIALLKCWHFLCHFCIQNDKNLLFGEYWLYAHYKIKKNMYPNQSECGFTNLKFPLRSTNMARDASVKSHLTSKYTFFRRTVGMPSQFWGYTNLEIESLSLSFTKNSKQLSPSFKYFIIPHK